MEQKKRVLIADGSAKFCDELIQALVKTGDFEIAGTANDGEQAINRIKEEQPDIFSAGYDASQERRLGSFKQLCKY